MERGGAAPRATTVASGIDVHELALQRRRSSDDTQLRRSLGYGTHESAVGGADDGLGALPTGEAGGSAGSYRLHTRRGSTRTNTLQMHIEVAERVQPDQPFRRQSSTVGTAVATAGAPVSAAKLVSERAQRPRSGRTSLSLLDQIRTFDANALPPAPPALDDSREPDQQSWFSECTARPLKLPLVADASSGGLGGPGEAIMHAPGSPRKVPGTPLPSPGWTFEDEDLPAWVDTSCFQPLIRVLGHILAQTAMALHSRQFEVRRVATMVSPLISEVIRWVDPAALPSLFAAGLAPRGSWLAYSTTLALRQSLAHVRHLRLSLPEDSSAAALEAPREVIAVVTSVVPTVLPALMDMVGASNLDGALEREAMGAVQLILLGFRDAIEPAVLREAEASWARRLGRLWLSSCREPPRAAMNIAQTLFLDGADAARQEAAPAASAAVIDAVESISGLLPDLMDTIDIDLALALVPALLAFPAELRWALDPAAPATLAFAHPPAPPKCCTRYHNAQADDRGSACRA